MQMKIYELTQEDVNIVFEKYRSITGAVDFTAPQVEEVRLDLLRMTIYEFRQLDGSLPDAKLLIKKEPNGDLRIVMNPNQLQDSELSDRLKKEFDGFGQEYIASRTRRWLP